MNKFTKISLIIFINVFIIALLLEILLRFAAPILPGTVGITARLIIGGSQYEQEWTQAWQQNIEHRYALRPNIENALQYGSPSVSFQLTTIELWDGGGIGFRTNPIDFFVDAIVVGDSFGMCFTERADCWVEQFSARTGLNVVNLSQPVTGTTSHYRILEDFGKPLEAPLVIWQFFGNDFNDDYGLAVFRDEIEELEAPATVEGDKSFYENLRDNSVLVAVFDTLYFGRIMAAIPDSDLIFVKPYRATYGDNNENILQFGGGYELQALDMSREVNQIGYNLSREAFLQAQAMVSAWGGELLVIIIPTREEVYRSITEPIMGDEINRLQSARDAMQDLCQELTLVCYDAYDAFIERAVDGEALYYSDDMHLNPYGNLVLSEALAVWLGEDGYLGE
jgi:hypothetical protein